MDEKKAVTMEQLLESARQSEALTMQVAEATAADITALETGKAAVGHTHTAEQVGAVPMTRKVNNKHLSADITLSASDVGALASGGTAAAATKLATARTIRTNLGSTSASSFDGTANVTPGVTGTLPVSRGGTGATTAAAALAALGGASKQYVDNAISSISSGGTKASATVPILTSEGAPVEIEIPDSLKGKTLLVEFISGYNSGIPTIKAQVYGVPLSYSEPPDVYEAYGCTFHRYGDTIYWGDFNQSASGMYLRFTEL